MVYASLFVQSVSPPLPRILCTPEQHGRWIEICLTKRPHHSDCGRDMRNDPLCWFQGQGANDVCFMPTSAESFEREVLASCPELKSEVATTDCSVNEHITWLRSCIGKATSLKPGMSRQDMWYTFREDGGMRTRQSARFIIEGCPGFKIRAEFAPSQQYDGEAADKIKSVSKPYLGRMRAD